MLPTKRDEKGRPKFGKFFFERDVGKSSYINRYPAPEKKDNPAKKPKEDK